MRKQTPVPFLKTYYKMFQDMASKQHKCTMIYIDQPPLPSLTSLILMRFIDWSNYSYLVKTSNWKKEILKIQMSEKKIPTLNFQEKGITEF